ncbi:MAG: FAD-binding oxidoreductase, partial [Clostridia bacterium]|nr:FAD-binding oxidoreductase [Clostridia bacterium]
MKNQCKHKPVWTDINKIPARFGWLDFNESCEVCVIGGGITGAMTALRLAESGMDTVLVTDEPVGFGSTSLAPSWGRYDSVGMLSTLCEKVGISTAQHVYSAQKKALESLCEFSKESENGFGFEKRDCVLYTNDPTEKQNMFREYQLRKNCGFDVEFASRSTLQDIFPFEAQCAIISKQLAAELDPYRLTHAAVAAAKRNGARIYENTRVISISETGGKCTLKTSTRRTVTASKIILAIGKECSEYVSGLGRMRSAASAVTKPLGFFD